MGILHRTKPRFHFDSSWLHINGFSLLSLRKFPLCSPIALVLLVPLMTGIFAKSSKTGGNQARKDKSNLTEQIRAFGVTASTVGLSDLGWSQRYSLETLLAFNRRDELYW